MLAQVAVIWNIHITTKIFDFLGHLLLEASPICFTVLQLACELANSHRKKKKPKNPFQVPPKTCHCRHFSRLFTRCCMIFFIIYKTLSCHETKTNKENSNVRSES
jgi:hypothetical protein